MKNKMTLKIFILTVSLASLFSVSSHAMGNALRIMVQSDQKSEKSCGDKIAEFTQSKFFDDKAPTYFHLHGTNSFGNCDLEVADRTHERFKNGVIDIYAYSNGEWPNFIQSSLYIGAHEDAARRNQGYSDSLIKRDDVKQRIESCTIDSAGNTLEVKWATVTPMAWSDPYMEFTLKMVRNESGQPTYFRMRAIDERMNQSLIDTECNLDGQGKHPERAQR